MKFTQAETKNIIKISQKLDFILADIPKAMYGMNLKEFLRGCNHVAIVNLFDTIYNLYTYVEETPHYYIWDLGSFEKNLKKIQSKGIKKDMSSKTYKESVERLVDCCYPSAKPYLGLMIVLNTDYNTGWRDIYNYFCLCEFKPQYRESYRLRPARQVKVYKPLADDKITKALQDSGYSKNELSFNIKLLNEKTYFFRGFIHILCGLQVLREKDYQFFDKRLLEKVIDDYWCREYEDSLTEYDRRAISADEDILLLEIAIQGTEDSNDIWKLKEQIKEIKRFIEQYKEDYEAQIQYIYNGFENKSDIWPTDEQCNALWLTYHNTHSTALLNSIVVLVREIPKKDWNCIIEYYATDQDRHIMLAQNPKLDMDSGDPYVIHPKLKRPITDSIVNRLIYNHKKYKKTTVAQIDIDWEKYNKADLRQDLMLIIFGLQSSGAEIINADIFSEVFKKQIERNKNGEPYIGVEPEMIYGVIKSICDDKQDEVLGIAISLDKGYKMPEVGNFFHKRILG